jgi:two-component system response regulator YesN
MESERCYRLLIVDDEQLAVDGLKAALDWESLHFSEVVAANSMRQAQREMDRSPIDVVLCDIEMPNGSGLDLLSWIRDQYPETETIIQTCHADFRYAQKALQLASFDYLLKPISDEDLREVFQRLMAKLERGKGEVAPIRDSSDQLDTPPPPVPDMTIWNLMLRNRSRDELLAEATNYLVSLPRSQCEGTAFLHRFFQDFLQMVYVALRSKGVSAHELFGDSESRAAETAAVTTLEGLLKWMHRAVDKAVAKLAAIETANSPVDRARDYIAAHINRDLGRRDIASFVNLHPDYLTRVFKRETGMGISDYIIGERMRVARDLLAKTEASVSDIALQVGYANFSHFSQMFKKTYGVPPFGYRRRYREENS